ncbi:MAG: LEA type 2 family protein [Thermodesulfobacteriota bacterium]
MKMASFLKPRMAAAWILIGFVWMAAGCAAPAKRLEPPRVSLVHIDLQEAKLFESVFKVQLRVFNTNEVPLEIQGGDCVLEVNGKRFAQGVTDSDTEVPAYGTAIVPMTLYSSMVGMVRSILTLPKEELGYELAGRLRIGGGFMALSTIPFSSEGKLSLEDLVEAP